MAVVTPLRKKSEKAPRKLSEQQGYTPATSLPHHKRHALQKSICVLEDTVQKILYGDASERFHDVDFLYWMRKLKNIATPISLALAEYGGPRVFHQHYKHDPKDYNHMLPVAGPDPLTTLAHVCRQALAESTDIVGVDDNEIKLLRDELEYSLRLFLNRYAAVRKL